MTRTNRERITFCFLLAAAKPGLTNNVFLDKIENDDTHKSKPGGLVLRDFFLSLFFGVDHQRPLTQRRVSQSRGDWSRGMILA